MMFSGGIALLAADEVSASTSGVHKMFKPLGNLGRMSGSTGSLTASFSWASTASAELSSPGVESGSLPSGGPEAVVISGGRCSGSTSTVRVLVADAVEDFRGVERRGERAPSMRARWEVGMALEIDRVLRTRS